MKFSFTGQKDTSRGIPKRLYKHLLSLPDVTQKLRRISMGKFAFRGRTPNSEVQEFGVRPRNARQGGPNMKRRLFILTATSLGLIGSVILIAEAQRDRPPMSFFVTSKGSGDGANLGGIAGADYMCQTLAEGMGSTKTWHAYLSTRAGDNAVTVLHARERIGTGPWYNSKGELIAKSLADLHGNSNNLNKQTALTEKGETIKGVGDTPNMHDILTGSRPDGTAYPRDEMDHTCYNWTSNKDTGSAQVGHFDRTGGGNTSWNSAHATRGCSQANLAATGGAGLFYCFAID